MFNSALSDTCVLRLKHLCLTCKTLVSVTQNTCVCQDKGLHLSDRGRKDGLKGSFLFCLTAVNRCIQEISARQDATPHLQQKEQAIFR